MSFRLDLRDSPFQKVAPFNRNRLGRSRSTCNRARYSCLRIDNRRFTRLTNAFSKKLENHFYALAIYFMHYNFVRQHQTLRVSPAMAAGVSKTLWSLEDMVEIVDQWEVAKAA